jgi:hypothetical protein
MATQVTPIQLLRSEVLNKRPDPTKLLPGQPAVNTNAAQPGFFFADDTGNTLFKVGPCSVGVVAPNTGATGNAGQLGNTLGELWLDTSPGPAAHPGPTLKVWSGTQWINCLPYTYANTIVADTAPSIADHYPGTLWWDSSTGLMYVLYDDGNTVQWTQVAASVVD